MRFPPTSSNPEDIINRGVDTKALISKQRDWNHCSSWVLRPPQEWPSKTFDKIQDTESTTDSTSITVNLTNTQENANLLNVIDITRYNTLNKTLRIAALVIHFVEKLRGYTNSQNTIPAMDLIWRDHIDTQTQRQTANKTSTNNSTAWPLFR